MKIAAHLIKRTLNREDWEPVNCKIKKNCRDVSQLTGNGKEVQQDVHK